MTASIQEITPLEAYLELLSLSKSLLLKGIHSTYTTSPYFIDEQSLEWYIGEVFHTITFWNSENAGLYLSINNGLILIENEFTVGEFKSLISNLKENCI